MKYRTLYYKDGRLRLIDQTKLPHTVEYIDCVRYLDVCEAIKTMKVRGAPAIGIAAAYAMVLAIDDLIKPNGMDIRYWGDALTELDKVADELNSTRPTAVNLMWATKRMTDLADECSRKYHGCPKTVCDKRYLKEHLLKAANAIYEEDARSCASIGENGASLIKNGMQILTHCNAGALATAEMGTALAPMYVAHKQGKNFNVYVDETRPLLQGARLTAWELKESGISTMLVTDNCAGKLMADFRVDIVIVGADRIAANGDVANKIGTYSLAVLCNYHKIPFYVAAPLSTFDLKCKSGRDIKIELRGSEEVTHLDGKLIAPKDITVFNPAFDVTPHELITGIITSHGIISPVDTQKIANHFAV